MKAAFALLALLTLTGPAAAQQGPEAEPRPVKLIAPTPETAARARRFYGHVVARQTVDLAFQVGGQIVKLPVLEGQELAEGGLVAQLDLDPFERALEQARLRLQEAERNLDRQRKLGPDRVSQVAIDDAETARDLAGIAVRDAEAALEDATLEAPFDALVATREVANYSTVSAGTPVARLHDMSELRVDIDVPEILFRGARRNGVYDFHAEFPGLEGRFALTPREFNAEASSIGQTYTLTLGFAPPPDLSILPGASATVVARRGDAQAEAAIFLPQSAVVLEPDRSAAVFVFEPDAPGGDAGTVRKVAVEIAADPDGRVRLVSGLEAGTPIAAAGAARLTDGQRVRRFAGFER